MRCRAQPLGYNLCWAGSQVDCGLRQPLHGWGQRKRVCSRGTLWAFLDQWTPRNEPVSVVGLAVATTADNLSLQSHRKLWNVLKATCVEYVQRVKICHKRVPLHRRIDVQRVKIFKNIYNINIHKCVPLQRRIDTFAHLACRFLCFMLFTGAFRPSRVHTMRG